MNIAGTMSVGPYHPMFEHCLEAMSKYCEKVFVRIDMVRASDDLYNMIRSKPYVGSIDCVYDQWNGGPKYREDCLRMLDSVRPSVVVALDYDEEFEPEFVEELYRFIASDKQAMMCLPSVPMPTDDGHTPINGRRYPSLPHMKVYKWKSGLSYYPYIGRDQIYEYASISGYEGQWKAGSHYRHYCFWTKDMEREKSEWVLKTYGRF